METISTLRYANRAKNIENKTHVNEEPKDALLTRFQQEIDELKKQLEDGVNGEKEHFLFKISDYICSFRVKSHINPMSRVFCGFAVGKFKMINENIIAFPDLGSESENGLSDIEFSDSADEIEDYVDDDGIVKKRKKVKYHPQSYFLELIDKFLVIYIICAGC